MSCQYTRFAIIMIVMEGWKPYDNLSNSTIPNQGANFIGNPKWKFFAFLNFIWPQSPHFPLKATPCMLWQLRHIINQVQSGKKEILQIYYWFRQIFHCQNILLACGRCMWHVVSAQHIDALVQDCSISIANALEILQSCTKPSISHCPVVRGKYNGSVHTGTHK